MLGCMLCSRAAGDECGPASLTAMLDDSRPFSPAVLPFPQLARTLGW